MKTIAILFVLFTTSAMSQTLNYCSPMSKNPKCWEGRSDRPEVSGFGSCLSYEACTKIKTVSYVNNGRAKAQHVCVDFKNKNFDCSKLVDLHGTNLYGLAVKIKMSSFDTCHRPGACGSRACVEQGHAFLDPQCQN